MFDERKYNSSYQAQRYQRRRILLKEILDNECVWCEATTDLEFDHIDPETKDFTISMNFSKPWSVLLDEIKKCQLLCAKCHKKKSARYIKVPHGGGKMGRNHCPCILCKNKRAEYMREYYRRTTN